MIECRCGAVVMEWDGDLGSSTVVMMGLMQRVEAGAYLN